MEEEKKIEPVQETKDEQQVEIKEEVKVEEKKEEIEINGVNLVEFETSIETKRQDFINLYKKAKKFSNLVTAVSMVLLITGLIFLFQKEQGFQIAGWIVLGVTVVGMIFYFIFNKNRLPDATKTYINYISSEYNNFVFNDECFEKVTTDPKEKLEMSSIVSDKVYSGVTRINSRNVVKGTFNKKDIFTIADCSAYVPGDKKNEKVCFLGKYISYYNKLSFEDRIIINYRTKDPIDLPTDLDGLVEINQSDLHIYAKDEETLKKTIPSKIINEIAKMEKSEHLLGFSIVFWQGHTAIYLSYDDVTITFPFQNPFKSEPIRTMKNEVITTLSIVDKLN